MSDGLGLNPDIQTELVDEAAVKFGRQKSSPKHLSRIEENFTTSEKTQGRWIARICIALLNLEYNVIQHHRIPIRISTHFEYNSNAKTYGPRSPR